MCVLCAGPQPPPSAFGAPVPQHLIPPPQPQVPPPTSLNPQGNPGDPHSPSPFAHAHQHPGSSQVVRTSLGNIPMDLGSNSASLSNLAQIFGGPFSSADFSKFQSMSGLNLSNFPSLPQVRACALW